ncbi:MAG: 3-oxoacyl-ACP synthase [Thermoflexibacter sp.]|nr:3-oxoacyl-ACP synthase [Thermoflexibacter sp.]
MLELKSQLYQYCMEYIEKRIQTIQNAIDEAQASANQETKSSMGDKYETTRSMLQLDTEMNTKQLVEAMKVKADLQKIEPSLHQIHDTIQVGSLVFTHQANYFIAIGAGKMTIGGKDFYAISPTAPIYKSLSGLKKGDFLTFNKQNILIKEIV